MRISCYQEAEMRSRRGQQRRTGSVGLPDVPKILLCSGCLALWSWWASCAAAAAAAAADSWEGRARKSEERQKQKWGFEARMEREREWKMPVSMEAIIYLGH